VYSTFDARVVGHQIKLQILGARRGAVKQLIGDRDGAGLTPRAAGVGEVPHVSVAADIAIVATDAASVLHTAVVGASDDDDFIRVTADLQLFPLAVFGQTCRAERTDRVSSVADDSRQPYRPGADWLFKMSLGAN